MINKKDLLKNLEKYSSEQIADAVSNNVVSLYELGHNTKGAFTPLLKREVKAILDNPISKSETINSVDETKIITTPPLPLSQNKEVETEENFQSNDFDIFDIEEDTEITYEGVEIMEETPTFDGQANNNSIHQTSKPRMFSRPFSFNGRIRRTEHGVSMIIASMIYVLLIYLSEEVVYSNDEELALLYFIILIPFIWFSLAQGVKRCHDLGNSGWYQLIPLYFFWMLFEEGNSMPNEYGNSPK